MLKAYELVYIPTEVNERLELLRGYKGKRVLVKNSDLMIPFKDQLISGKVSKVERVRTTCFYYLEGKRNPFNVEFLEELWVENTDFKREWTGIRKRANKEAADLVRKIRRKMSR